MHLADLLERRPVPAAAIFLTLTRRCPLHCQHCSTRSAQTSQQQPAASLRRFAGSFSTADHPEFLLLTGGEPLLRPGLVRTLAETARAAGTRSYVLTGAYFASGGRTPGTIRGALESVDHVAISIDVFHEAEVPRPQVFRVLHELLDAGIDASVQACGAGPGDPYLVTLAEQIRQEFADRVPMLATVVSPVGRARSWLVSSAAGETAAEDRSGGRIVPALPCDMASWPVVGFDGTITACCNTDVLDSRPAPAHLRLGHIATTTWPEVRHACVSSPVLRGLRTEGPLRLAARMAGPGQVGRGDYCQTCRALADRPEILRRVGADAARPVAVLIEQQAIALQLRAGPVAFARRHGAPALADLVLLGRPTLPGEQDPEAAAC
ncbi:MAG: radical SAM protein [Streptosporangiaceae bacterium]|nr:radical SAM protein [Streptosporangiaceae bacterium]